MIPEIVLKQAKGLIDLFGEKFKYLGVYQEKDVYLFCFPENKETGFPFVYLYDETNESVEEITGYEALDIIGELKSKLNI